MRLGAALRSAGVIFLGAMTLLCLSDAARAETPPARVTQPAREAELTSITLTPDAERRLGIVTAAVERRAVTRTRLFGGEITPPAPVHSGGGQSVFSILATLSPAELVRLAQSQIEADGQVEQARVQLDGARQALHRAEQMRRDKVGTDRTVDETRVQVGQAEAALHTAQARRDLLGPAILDSTSPTEVWVRAPVYVDDLPKLDRAVPAHVGPLADAPGTANHVGTPVDAPPSANPAAATVDIFYRLQNPDRALRLGQRVGVTIPLRQQAPALTIPFSAIIYDIDGGTWVYEQTAASSYVRRRVQVDRAAGDVAIVVNGVKPGAKVVTIGAAELFGVEFGVGK